MLIKASIGDNKITWGGIKNNCSRHSQTVIIVTEPKVMLYTMTITVISTESWVSLYPHRNGFVDHRRKYIRGSLHCTVVG